MEIVSITTKMEWHKFSEKSPSESGWYLVITKRGKFQSCSGVHYSKKYDEFNQFDDRAPNGRGWGKDYVVYWAEEPKLP